MPPLLPLLSFRLLLLAICLKVLCTEKMFYIYLKECFLALKYFEDGITLGINILHVLIFSFK